MNQKNKKKTLHPRADENKKQMLDQKCCDQAEKELISEGVWTLINGAVPQPSWLMSQHQNKNGAFRPSTGTSRNVPVANGDLGYLEGG